MPRLSAPLRTALIAAGYLVAALCVLGGTALAPGERAVGIPSIDSFDTAMLRGLVADAVAHASSRSDGVFFPTGLEVLELTPNLLDHLTALPLVELLPFPLSDTVWWWLVLALNGMAGHWLGRRLGGSDGAGWLVGLSWLTCDAALREANLHHAPQAMLFWVPVLFGLLLTEREQATDRTAALAGLALATGAWAYWYAGLFAVLAGLPLLLRQKPRHLAIGAGVAVLLCAPALLPQLIDWADRPLTSGAPLAPPRGVPDSFQALDPADQFVAWHGVDPLFFFRDLTTDTSNRVPVFLLLGAVLGARRLPRQTRRALGWSVALGAVMVLGPVLRWGEEVVLVGGEPIPLPFAGFGSLHPFLARLTWPERWGFVMVAGLTALAAHSPRPGALAVAVLLENALLSGNLPLQHHDLRHELCWAELDHAPGAIVELPLDRGLRSARAAVHGRIHGRPVVNPVLLPPGAPPPAEWHAWSKDTEMMQWLAAVERGRAPGDPGRAAVQDLHEAGVSAIALDVEPGVARSEGRQNRVRTLLSQALGPPVDLGCALVWWLDPTVPPPQGIDDGDAWREAATSWKTSHPAPDLDVHIQPMWDRLRLPTERGAR